MQNSVKAGFDKKENSDGSIEIAYKDVHPVWGESMFGTLVIAGWLVAWVSLLLGLSMIIFSGKLDMAFAGLILVVPSWAYIMFKKFFFSKLIFKERIIKIIPNVGIKFDDVSIPFKDINSFSIISRNDYGGLTCQTKGTDVCIINAAPITVTETIKDEMKLYSGKTWG